jgi:hypothetical protein
LVLQTTNAEVGKDDVSSRDFVSSTGIFQQQDGGSPLLAPTTSPLIADDDVPNLHWDSELSDLSSDFSRGSDTDSDRSDVVDNDLEQQNGMILSPMAICA